jgi:hypothetical protein
MIGQTPFQMVYGQEAMVPLEFVVPSLCVATITNITERGPVQERLGQLMIMEEDRMGEEYSLLVFQRLYSLLSWAFPFFFKFPFLLSFPLFIFN